MNKSEINPRAHLRIWRRDAFRQLMSILPEQEYLPWYQAQGIRLKNYVEPYFDALDGRKLEDVEAREIEEVIRFFKDHGESLDMPFLLYVGELLLAVKGDREPRLFEGFELKCCCGGKWVLNRTSLQVKGWKYYCNTCNARSNADISGFPISLPAPKSVVEGRGRLHSQLKALSASYPQMSFDDIYTLLSYYTSTPMGYVHFGYLQTDEAINRFSLAMGEIERDFERVASGATASQVLNMH